MALSFRSKNAMLEHCEMTAKAAKEMRDALNIISDLLPENGKRCDKRFYDKVDNALRALGCPAKFQGNKIRVYKDVVWGLYADVFPTGTACTESEITTFFENTRGGIMRDVDALRNQIAALARACALYQNAAEKTTAARLDAFMKSYEKIRKAYDELRDNAPFGISSMMDYIGACPIY